MQLPIRDYKKSLERFLDLTDIPGVYTTKFPVGKDSNGDPLEITARHLPATSKPQNFLVLNAGDHGNECAYGEAVLREFTQRLLPEISDDTSVMMIYGTNPEARLQGTRHDANWQDHMRCYVHPDRWEEITSKTQTPQLDQAKESITKLLNPERPIHDIYQESAKFLYELAGLTPELFKHHPDILYGLGMGGSYDEKNEGNLFFACRVGTRIPQMDFFDEAVVPFGRHHNNFKYQTYHTGIGSKARGHTLLTNRRSDGVEIYRRFANVSLYSPESAKKLIDDGEIKVAKGLYHLGLFIMDSLFTERSMTIDAQGSPERYLCDVLRGTGNLQRVSAATFEATTGPVLSNTMALVQSHQVLKHNDPNDSKQRAIIDQVHEITQERFVPSNPAWQRKAINVAMRNLREIMKNFGYAKSNGKLLNGRSHYVMNGAAK